MKKIHLFPYEKIKKIEKDKLLVFDLDETLIYSSTKKLGYAPPFKCGQYYVYTRPHLLFILENLSQYYGIGIWSAADEDYVIDIVQQIIPSYIDLEFIWDKKWCQHIENNKDSVFIKPLDKLDALNWQISQILLVDDNLEQANLFYNQTYPIKPFKGDKNDRELIIFYQWLLERK